MSTKAEDTQKNILNTARKHFLKDGLTGASLRNIVKDAGLTTGAFYKYYPTKEALFDALTDPYMEHIYQIYDQIVEEFEKLSASDQTRNMSDHMHKAFLYNRYFHTVLFHLFHIFQAGLHFPLYHIVYE